MYTYGGKRDEDKIDAVEKRPARLQRPENKRWNEKGKDEEKGAQHSQVHQSYLNLQKKLVCNRGSCRMSSL
jgi:hypothetical protein